MRQSQHAPSGPSLILYIATQASHPLALSPAEVRHG